MVMVKIKKKPKQSFCGRNYVWIVTVVVTTFMYILLMGNQEIKEAKASSVGEEGKFRKKASPLSSSSANPPLDPNIYLPKLQGKLPLSVSRRKRASDATDPTDEESSASSSSYSLAIMVDASLDHFPIEFLERLLDYMALLQNYDTLHLRLTSDTEFLYKSTSHPELATTTSNQQNLFYTSRQLQQLLRYASKRGISIVPELSIPSHAGSWGVDYVVPCPTYTCEVGQDIPLDLSNPTLLEIVQDLLGELVGLGFGTIHLGGSTNSSNGSLKDHECYLEAGLDGDALHLTWEQQLIEMILPDVPLDPENIIRWSSSGSNAESARRLGTDHEEKQHRDLLDYSSLGYSTMYRPSTGQSSSSPSHARDTDWYTLDGSGSVLDLFTAAKKATTTGVFNNLVLSTEGVALEQWESMALWTKMVAVAMGVSNEFGQEEFFGSFQQTCYSVLDDHMCSMTATGQQLKQQADAREQQARSHVCESLTDVAEVLILRPPQESVEAELELARTIFERRHDTGMQKREAPSQLFEHNEFQKLRVSAASYPEGRPQRQHEKPLVAPHKLGHTGITVDTTRYFFPLTRLLSLLDQMGKLGFNTLHLRLTDDYAFAAKFATHPNLALATKKNGQVYTVEDLHKLRRHAHKNGIEIIPEVNILSRAGGWFQSGLLIPCPHFACDVGCGMPLDLDVHTLAILTNVLDEILSIFNSPFLHLGYDEREESRPCYKEANMDVSGEAQQELSLEREKKMAAVIKMLGIPSEHIIRWESTDKKKEEETRFRTGRITHYHSNTHPTVEYLQNLEDPAVFLSTDSLNFASPTDIDGYTIYKQMHEVSKQEKVLGVLAGTLEMGPVSWNGRNVEGKLVALAMGAAANDIVPKDEFEKAFRKIFKDLEIDGDTAISFGKSRWSDKEFDRHMKEQRKARQELMCSRTTTTAQQRIAKRRKGS